MMKFTRLFLFSVAVVLCSCDKENDPQPTSQGMLGTWTMTSLQYGGSTTTSAQGVSIKSDFTGTGKDLDVTTTFDENPNTVVSQGNYTIVLTTTMMGQTTTQEIPLEDVLMDGTWSLNGQKLTVTATGQEPQEATILEQTSTTLKFKIEVEESETSQNVTITTKIQATYNFEKQ